MMLNSALCSVHLAFLASMAALAADVTTTPGADSAVGGPLGGLIGGLVGGGFSVYVAWYLLTKTMPNKDKEHADTIKVLVDAFSSELKEERTSRQKDRELRHDDSNRMVAALMENTLVIRQASTVMERIEAKEEGYRAYRDQHQHEGDKGHD